MVMKSMRGEGKYGGVLKYFLFTLLGMAVGGLVLSSFADTNSIKSNDVARIGDKSITIQSFDRAFQRTISRFGISTTQAYKIGMADNILTDEIRRYILLNEAEELGIEIGKERIAKRIAEIVKPYTKDGQSLQETLDNLLARQAMKEKDFIHEIKKEMSAEILINTIKNGFSPNIELLANDLYMFQSQTRDIDIIIFPDNRISIEPATQEQLKRLYETTKLQKYKIPEYRSVIVASFDPDKADIKFSVSEEELQNAYEEHKDRFQVGEQFTLSQIVTKDEKQAQEIYNLTQQEENALSLKDAVIKVMGENAPYIENVNFETSMMLPELMEALKSREIGKIVAPIKTMIGYHVVRLDDIVAPSIRPYEEVRKGIEREIIKTKKADYFYDIANQFDTMISEGLSFEEISKNIDIDIYKIDFIDSNGLNKQGQDGLKNFNDTDKEAIISTIFEIEDDSTASVMQDFGGKLISFKINKIEEQSFKPFEEVKDEIAKQFIKNMQKSENEMQMRKYLEKIKSNKVSMETIANDNDLKIEKISNISIGKEPSSPLIADNIPIIFKTPYGEYEAIRLDGKSAIIKISGYGYSENEQGDGDSNRKTAIESIKTRILEEGKEEAVLLYLKDIGKKHPATINQRLLERVYGENN